MMRHILFPEKHHKIKKRNFARDIKTVEAILHRLAKSKLLMEERLIRKTDLNLAVLENSQNASDLNLSSPLILKMLLATILSLINTTVF